MPKKLNTPRIVGLSLCLLVIAILVLPFIFKGYKLFLPFLALSPIMYFVFYFGWIKGTVKHAWLYIISLLIIAVLIASLFFWYSSGSSALPIFAALFFGQALNLLIWGEKAWMKWKP